MKIHFTGIKGVGMTALAQILKSQGNIIYGSDVSEDFVTKSALRELGISINNFDAHNISQEIDLVIYSPAFDIQHPEIQKAQDLGITIKSYPEQLAKIFDNKISSQFIFVINDYCWQLCFL